MAAMHDSSTIRKTTRKLSASAAPMRPALPQPATAPSASCSHPARFRWRRPPPCRPTICRRGEAHMETPRPRAPATGAPQPRPPGASDSRGRHRGGRRSADHAPGRRLARRLHPVARDRPPSRLRTAVSADRSTDDSLPPLRRHGLARRARARLDRRVRDEQCGRPRPAHGRARQAHAPAGQGVRAVSASTTLRIVAGTDCRKRSATAGAKHAPAARRELHRGCPRDWGRSSTGRARRDRQGPLPHRSSPRRRASPRPRPVCMDVSPAGGATITLTSS